jgi:hypothetical protein
VLGTFGLTNRQLDGDHKLPEALTVFGSLKVSVHLDLPRRRR